uniref:Uncharacterized protein n=1 Tax=Alexandrium monilatum TaxID=311494 RepID=A0A7S4PTL1_9DINO
MTTIPRTGRAPGRAAAAGMRWPGGAPHSHGRALGCRKQHCLCAMLATLALAVAHSRAVRPAAVAPAPSPRPVVLGRRLCRPARTKLRARGATATKRKTKKAPVLAPVEPRAKEDAKVDARQKTAQVSLETELRQLSHKTWSTRIADAWRKVVRFFL